MNEVVKCLIDTNHNIHIKIEMYIFSVSRIQDSLIIGETPVSPYLVHAS